MEKSKWLWIPVLLLVLAACFIVRALPASLPSLSEAEKAIYLDETGAPYLTEMDSYFYARLAREMTESGRTQLYNIRDEDPLMSQRPVAQPDPNLWLPVLLPALAYWIWRVLSFFGAADIGSIVRWMGPVLGTLSAVPAFLYVRRRTNVWGGLAAGLLAGLSLPFVCHTHFGFFDTDMLLCLLPLGFLTLELRAMQLSRLRSQVIAGAGSALMLAMLSMTWFAFYTYYWLMVLGGLIGLLLTMAFARCPFRRKLVAVRGWLLSLLPALLLVFLFRGAAGLEALGSVIAIFRSVSGSEDAFPFGWQFIGEMQALAYFPDTASRGVVSLLASDLRSGLGAVGGILPCLFAAAAVPLGTICSRQPRKEPDAPDRADRRIAALTEAAVMLLWLGFGVVLMKSRQRFTEIAALPAAVLAGLAVGFVTRGLRLRKAWIRIPLRAALAVGVCVSLVLGSWAYARGMLPGVTDSLASAMAWIRETQSENAVIASWWDYGYFMQYASRRRVIFDGGYTGGDDFYLLGHALLSDDPARGVGIFRMLETSGVAAISDLTSCGATQAEAAEYLLRIASMDRAETECTEPPAEMTAEQFAALLDKTHPLEEMPLLIVLSDDIITKLTAVSYYGLWDMETTAPSGSVSWAAAAQSEKLSPGETAVFETENRAVSLIARMEDDGTVRGFLMVNRNSVPLSRLCVWRNGEKTQDTSLGIGDIAAVLVEEEGRFACFFCSPVLCDSLLVRLFVCADQTIPGIRLLGSWENPGEGDLCPAQRRIHPEGGAGQYVQVWEAKETLP